MDEICRFVRPYWKVPDTSLHLRESARERARRVAAPYYKPRVAEAVAETEAVVTGAPVASPWTRIHEIDAVFHLELFPLPRETARRSRRFREIRGSLSLTLSFSFPNETHPHASFSLQHSCCSFMFSFVSHGHVGSRYLTMGDDRPANWRPTLTNSFF